jgi:CRP-like cAMP-binding protein
MIVFLPISIRAWLRRAALTSSSQTKGTGFAERRLLEASVQRAVVLDKTRGVAAALRLKRLSERLNLRYRNERAVSATFALLPNHWSTTFVTTSRFFEGLAG